MSQTYYDIKEELEDFTQFLHSINLNLVYKKEEPPDFLALHENKVVGIEHRRIFQPVDKKGINLQHQEAVKRKIVTKAEQLLNNSTDHKAIISVNFRGIYGLNRDKARFELFDRDVKDLANEIFKTVLRYIDNDSTAITINRMNCRNLDYRISEISIDKFDSLKKSSIDHGPGGLIPEITKEYIEQEVQAKDEKVNNYLKKCDLVWLLLVVDSNIFERSFDDLRLSEIQRWKFDTKFDSVFIFMKRKLQAYQLKLI